MAPHPYQERQAVVVSTVRILGKRKNQVQEKGTRKKLVWRNTQKIKLQGLINKTLEHSLHQFQGCEVISGVILMLSLWISCASAALGVSLSPHLQLIHSDIGW